MTELEVNIPDVALIIEGGGMRASYTAGVIVTLLERELYFGDVYGISAGASHAVNYVSRDKLRTKESFVDVVNDPRFGGLATFLRGEGYFNAHYLYEGMIEEFDKTGKPMAFDFQTFAANPANVHIEAFDWDSGETVTWTKADMPDPYEMAIRVRASSTMPLFMPPTTVDGRVYVDGGLGSSWGIPLARARDDGYTRFFIVRTQERGYRKKPPNAATMALFRFAYRNHPAVSEATEQRWLHYNAIEREIEQLERDGAACVFYPESMPITNKEEDFGKLQAAYDEGYTQAQREVDTWESWLAKS